MKASDLKKATLEELRRKKEAGQLFHDPAALAGETLGPQFWRDATKEQSRSPQLPPQIKSLHNGNRTVLTMG
jgi:hypothetical protein